MRLHSDATNPVPTTSTEEPKKQTTNGEVFINQIPVTLTKEEREAFKYYTTDLIPNPRRIKRIVNVYRFARLLVPKYDDVQRAKLIRWIILTEQWPFRTAWILQDIENNVQQGKLDDAYREHTLEKLYETVKPHILAKKNEKFLTIDNDPDLFDLFIKNGLNPSGDKTEEEISNHVLRGTVVTVDDIEGKGKRTGLRQLSFNLNPAIQDEVAKMAMRMLVSEVPKNGGD